MHIFPILNSGNCRVLAFPSYFLIADKCLEGHTILIVQHVPDMGLCELLCYNQPNCVSVNYEIQTQKRCELNNSTHRAHDADFKEREGCLYHGAIVSFLSCLFVVFFSFMICFHHLQGDHYLIIVIIITRDVIFVIRSERLLKVNSGCFKIHRSFSMSRFVKCWWIFRVLNSKGLYVSWKK